VVAFDIDFDECYIWIGLNHVERSEWCDRADSKGKLLMADVAIKRKRVKTGATVKSPKVDAINRFEPPDEFCLGEDIAQDNADWDQAFASTTDEEYDALIKTIRESIRTNGTTPLDFNRKG
jgi:hypothetical protein